MKPIQKPLFPLLSLLLGILILLPSQELQAQLAPNPELQIPCARYRTGKMDYTDKNFGGIRIKRKRRKEIQFNDNTENKLIFKIEWVSDCEYKLTFKKSKKPSRYRKGWEVNVKMVRIEEEFYDFDWDLHGIVFYGTARKEMTKWELREKQKKEIRMLKKMEQDSIRAIEVKDSMATAAKMEADKKAPMAVNPEIEEAGEDGESGKKKKDKGSKKNKKKKKKDKGDKKKDKKKKDKKEKAPKEKKKKEKKEKPPKEKKPKKDKKKSDDPEEEEDEG